LPTGYPSLCRNERRAWNITPLPVYPVAHIVAYASSGIAFQFLAAWLLMPATVENGTFWGRYAVTVGLCIIAGLVAAFVLLFLGQALLDAGKI